MWATSAHPVQLNAWKQTQWIYWMALRGPPLALVVIFTLGGPREPSTSGWHHGSRTIMMRLARAWTQSPGTIASHPPLCFFFFFVLVHLQNHTARSFCFQHLPLFLSMPLSCFNSDLSMSLSQDFTFSSLTHWDSFPGLICISKGTGGSLYQTEELSRAAGWILKHSSVRCGNQFSLRQRECQTLAWHWVNLTPPFICSHCKNVLLCIVIGRTKQRGQQQVPGMGWLYSCL